MRRSIVTAFYATLAVTAIALAATPARAQTIRGSVIDRATSRPLAEVQIMLIDAEDKVIGPGVRSDSIGLFTTHAGRAGRYRLLASRIGYQPLRSEPLELDLGQLFVLRLEMTTVPQQLPTVRIVERRTLHASELMTAAGFDLRRTRGTGDFMTADDLAAFGSLDVRELLRGVASGNLFIRSSMNGEVLTLLSANNPNGCAPEILLDGLPLASGSPLDESSGRREAALATLGNYTAKDLHGIEVYRAREIPPPSMAGLLGTSQGAVPRNDRSQCGVVAIWTKRGVRRSAENPRARDGSRTVQVVRGTVANFEDGSPIANATARLIEGKNKTIGEPAQSDSTGVFTIRTTRAGTFRLVVTGSSFRSVTTPDIHIAGEDLLVVQVYVSPTRDVRAPIALERRVSPRDFEPGSFAAFTYRRERGITGTFLAESEIAKSGALTVKGLAARLVSMADVARALGVTAIRGPRPNDATCAPTWFVDGSAIPASGVDAVERTPIANVIGMEMYESPKDAPEIFAASVANDCRLVLVWTRP